MPRLVALLYECLRAVVAERDELRATCDNERGEGVPPSEGWAWRLTAHAQEEEGDEHGWYNGDKLAVPATHGWVWQVVGGEADLAPTARAAMIAADASGAKS